MFRTAVRHIAADGYSVMGLAAFVAACFIADRNGSHLHRGDVSASYQWLSSWVDPYIRNGTRVTCVRRPNPGRSAKTSPGS